MKCGRRESREIAVRWLIVVITVLAAVACDDGPTQVEFHDFLASRSFATDRGALQATEAFASDETWVAVTLEPGVAVAAEFDVLSKPVLTLAGFLECREALPSGAEAVLTGEVSARGGRQVRFSIDLATARGWWSRDVDLGRAANRSVDLILSLEAPEGCVLRLREATIRQYRIAAPSLTEAPKQVVLISADTLRHDAIGAFGGSCTTPNLDRLVAESESFFRHYAAASWTKPSHASILTGFNPQVHRAQLLDQAIDPSIPTLAQRFGGGGFTTAALVFDCGWLSPRWGFAKGFDSYRVNRWRTARQAREVFNWIQSHRDEPFFLFFHTFEPHSDAHVLPYEAPGVNRVTIADTFGVEGFGCRQGRCASGFLEALQKGVVPRQPRDAEILRETYAAGVEYLDDALGVLFESLRESGTWDQLLVVVTSDHGEEFAEHGGFGHHTLYDEVLRVPLIIKWPRGDRAGSSNDSVNTAVDLAPTLLEFAGLATDGLQGSHLHRRSAETPLVGGTLDRAVVAGGYKAIFSFKPAPVRLFDLTHDPGELTNLAEADPERIVLLEGMLRIQNERDYELWRRIGSANGTRDVVLSDAERERLKAFGYLE